VHSGKTLDLESKHKGFISHQYNHWYWKRESGKHTKCSWLCPSSIVVKHLIQNQNIKGLCPQYNHWYWEGENGKLICSWLCPSSIVVEWLAQNSKIKG